MILERIMINNIKSIGIHNREIAVRVIRKWERPVWNKKNEIYSLEFVLMDAEKNMIEASAHKRVLNRFNHIEEGNCYVIQRFRAESNLVAEKATKNGLRLFLNFSTVAEEDNSLFIPPNTFNFISFEDIMQHTVTSQVLEDAIGLFVDYDAMCFTKEGSPWLKIYIEDTSNQRLSVCVFDKHARHIQQIISEYKSRNEPFPILVFKFVQISVYLECEPKLCTTRGPTQIFVNPGINEVSEFRKKLDAMGISGSSFLLSQPSNNGSHILAGAKIKTLEEIKNSTKAGVFVTKVYVVDIDSVTSWYYDSCTKCRGKVIMKDDGLWYCEKKGCKDKDIGKTDYSQRFQLKLFVQGGVDIYAEFMLWDDQVQPILDITPSEILERQKKIDIHTVGDMPSELRVFILKEIVAKVKVTQTFNIQQDSTCYSVLSLSFKQEILEKWTTLASNAKDNVTSSSGSNITADIPNTEHELMENLRSGIEDEPFITPTSKVEGKRITSDVDITPMTGLQQSTSKAEGKRKVSDLDITPMTLLEEYEKNNQMSSAAKKIMKVKLEKK